MSTYRKYKSNYLQAYSDRFNKTLRHFHDSTCIVSDLAETRADRNRCRSAVTLSGD